ncbi:MAG: cyclic nucleotide-binding domain-containing protein [Kiloniellales bacterium]|nr:cyclic nucleotide-binding domain-containing protein [Kiloniellales bacterium]
MSIEQEVEILRNIPMFAKIEPAKLKLMAFASERLSFKPGQVLFKQGDAGDSAYIMIEGTADVIVDTPDGELRVAQLSRNDIVGEIAILCDVPRTATVRASDKVTTLKITTDLFFRMVTDFPDMGIEIMRSLAQRLENTTAQLREARAAGK